MSGWGRGTCRQGESGKPAVCQVLALKQMQCSRLVAMEQYSYAPPLLSPSEDHQATPSYRHCGVAAVNPDLALGMSGWGRGMCGQGRSSKPVVCRVLALEQKQCLRLVAMDQYSYAPPLLSPSEDHQATPSYQPCGVAVGQSILIWHQACQVGEEDCMGRAGAASLLFVGSLPWGGALDMYLYDSIVYCTPCADQRGATFGHGLAEMTHILIETVAIGKDNQVLHFQLVA
ncbi:hypothetical protein EI94DRAFT_1708154 [Lactarius quietus]|nr:hypothetical protein EI94DRAFT_1708154 [Lactarius quietus]